MAVQITVTPAALFATGAFDNMLTGTRFAPARRLEAIKIVRQIAGAGLYETKEAMDNRMLAMEQASTDAILADLRRKLCDD